MHPCRPPGRRIQGQPCLSELLQDQGFHLTGEEIIWSAIRDGNKRQCAAFGGGSWVYAEVRLLLWEIRGRGGSRSLAWTLVSLTKPPIPSCTGSGYEFEIFVSPANPFPISSWLEEVTRQGCFVSLAPYTQFWLVRWSAPLGGWWTQNLLFIDLEKESKAVRSQAVWCGNWHQVTFYEQYLHVRGW